MLSRATRHLLEMFRLQLEDDKALVDFDGLPDCSSTSAANSITSLSAHSPVNGQLKDRQPRFEPSSVTRGGIVCFWLPRRLIASCPSASNSNMGFRRQKLPLAISRIRHAVSEFSVVRTWVKKLISDRKTFLLREARQKPDGHFRAA
jgi:hypothetical protein